MKHPYVDFEDTEEWNQLHRLIQDLIDNNDMEIYTPIEYVVGYLCKGLNLPIKKHYINSQGN